MTDIVQKEIKLIENLQDAGCDSNFVEQFLELKMADKTKAQLNLLAKHRALLLCGLHDSQKKLDCLDYLIYSIRKGKIN